MECGLLCGSLVLFIAYKILDRLIRIPRVGRYSERCILVTGCDSGFGRELAERLDRIGCHVFAGCFTERGETELRKSCSDRLQTIPLDISKPESVKKAFEVVTARLPEGRGLWGLMNNAATSGTVGALPWHLTDTYRDVLKVNVVGTIDVTMTFLPLIKASRGRIVNTSSAMGRLSVESTLPYCVSKYGVEAFTDGLRRSLRVFGCHAAIVEPGGYKTAMGSVVRRSLRVFGCHAAIVEPGGYKTAMGSVEHFDRSIDQAWNQTTQEVRDEYGEEYYRCTKQAFMEMTGLFSSQTSDVTDAYIHALLGRYPRTRYLVGFDANFVFWPLTILPEWMADNLMELIFARSLPLPAAVKNK